MKCPKCGKENLSDAKFCTMCFTRFELSAEGEKKSSYHPEDVTVTQPKKRKSVLIFFISLVLIGLIGFGIFRFLQTKDSPPGESIKVEEVAEETKEKLFIDTYFEAVQDVDGDMVWSMLSPDYIRYCVISEQQSYVLKTKEELNFAIAFLERWSDLTYVYTYGDSPATCETILNNKIVKSGPILSWEIESIRQYSSYTLVITKVKRQSGTIETVKFFLLPSGNTYLIKVVGN